jgi:hypothetical protein
MRKLRDKLYKKIEKGLDVKCPHLGCKGLVLKVSVEDFEQYSEVYWEKTNFYRCTRNRKHIWKYLTEATNHID